MANVGKIVEGGPLEGVVAVAVWLGDGNAVVFDELPQLLEVSVGCGRVNVDDMDFVRVSIGGLLFVGIGNNFDFRRRHVRFNQRILLLISGLSVHKTDCKLSMKLSKYFMEVLTLGFESCDNIYCSGEGA